MLMSNEAKPSDAGEEQLDGTELDGELRDFAEAQPDPHAHTRAARTLRARRARAWASGRRRRRRKLRRSAWFSSARRKEEKRQGLALALAALAAASRCAGAPRRLPRARLGHVPKREDGRFN